MNIKKHVLGIFLIFLFSILLVFVLTIIGVPADIQWAPAMAISGAFGWWYAGRFLP